MLAPFLRLFSNTIGNGHWFDTYVANLGPFNAGVGFPQASLPTSTAPTGANGSPLGIPGVTK